MADPVGPSEGFLRDIRSLDVPPGLTTPLIPDTRDSTNTAEAVVLQQDETTPIVGEAEEVAHDGGEEFTVPPETVLTVAPEKSTREFTEKFAGGKALENQLDEQDKLTRDEFLLLLKGMFSDFQRRRTVLESTIVRELQESGREFIVDCPNPNAQTFTSHHEAVVDKVQTDLDQLNGIANDFVVKLLGKTREGYQQVAEHRFETNRRRFQWLEREQQTKLENARASKQKELNAFLQAQKVEFETSNKISERRFQKKLHNHAQLILKLEQENDRLVHKMESQMKSSKLLLDENRGRYQRENNEILKHVRKLEKDLDSSNSRLKSSEEDRKKLQLQVRAFAKKSDDMESNFREKWSRVEVEMSKLKQHAARETQKAMAARAEVAAAKASASVAESRLSKAEEDLQAAEYGRTFDDEVIVEVPEEEPALPAAIPIMTLEFESTNSETDIMAAAREKMELEELLDVTRDFTEESEFVLGESYSLSDEEERKKKFEEETIERREVYNRQIDLIEDLSRKLCQTEEAKIVLEAELDKLKQIFDHQQVEIEELQKERATLRIKEKKMAQAGKMATALKGNNTKLQAAVKKAVAYNHDLIKRQNDAKRKMIAEQSEAIRTEGAKQKEEIMAQLKNEKIQLEEMHSKERDALQENFVYEKAALANRLETEKNAAVEAVRAEYEQKIQKEIEDKLEENEEAFREEREAYIQNEKILEADVVEMEKQNHALLKDLTNLKTLVSDLKMQLVSARAEMQAAVTEAGNVEPTVRETTIEKIVVEKDEAMANRMEALELQIAQISRESVEEAEQFRETIVQLEAEKEALQARFDKFYKIGQKKAPADQPLKHGQSETALSRKKFTSPASPGPTPISNSSPEVLRRKTSSVSLGAPKSPQEPLKLPSMRKMKTEVELREEPAEGAASSEAVPLERISTPPGDDGFSLSESIDYAQMTAVRPSKRSPSPVILHHQSEGSLASRSPTSTAPTTTVAGNSPPIQGRGERWSSPPYSTSSRRRPVTSPEVSQSDGFEVDDEYDVGQGGEQVMGRLMKQFESVMEDTMVEYFNVLFQNAPPMVEEMGNCAACGNYARISSKGLILRPREMHKQRSLMIAEYAKSKNYQLLAEELSFSALSERIRADTPSESLERPRSRLGSIGRPATAAELEGKGKGGRLAATGGGGLISKPNTKTYGIPPHRKLARPKSQGSMSSHKRQETRAAKHTIIVDDTTSRPRSREGNFSQSRASYGYFDNDQDLRPNFAQVNNFNPRGK